VTRRRADDGTRRPSITAATPSPHLSGLSLEELRVYRRGLTAEEDRTSYWRRVVHARKDVLEAESRAAGTLSFEDLVRALGDTGTGRRRKALLRLRDAEPMPELPVLAEMWVSEVDPHDEAAVADALERLTTAEQQLTTYRRALHERIDEATAELIVRYRADPSLALAALPGSRAC
jgi:hypothetical protein